MGNSFAQLRTVWTPLIKAESPDKLVDFLFQYPSALHVVDVSGRSILHDAAEFGTASAISVICGQLNEQGGLFNGKNALHIAIQYRRPLAIITTLVEQGISMSTQDLSGNTPLHIAIVAGREDIVAAFAHRNTPSLMLARWDGLTPLDTAVSYGYGRLATLLLSAGSIPDSQILWRVLHQIWSWDTELYVNGKRFENALPPHPRKRVDDLKDFAHIAMDYFVLNKRVFDPRAASVGLVGAINHPELAAVAKEIQERASHILNGRETIKNLLPVGCHLKQD